MSNADYSAGELEARRESWAGRPCPVEGCQQRFTNADTAGRHLDRVHDERGRWTANRYRAIDEVGDGDDAVIYDITNGKRWVRSSLSVEVPE